MTVQKPLVLTAGDPSGVGPEITVKAWKAVGQTHPFAVLGDVEQFSELGTALNAPILEITNIDDIRTDALCVLRQEFPKPPKPGIAQMENAAGTIEMIGRAVKLVQSGQASAVVTNPINKRTLIEGAGFSYPGHTEYLAHLDGKVQSVMMLATPELRVIPVTIHMPLKDVGKHLTSDLLERSLNILSSAMKRDLGIAKPRIAVAGLNPHAGEGGQMGTEEFEIISPVLDKFRRSGMDVAGPMSADTMFHAKARSNYDVAVCMYHDQALIPIKTIDFDRGVNVTLGLSFIRTSPDHGTAEDIAGKGQANPSSLIEAIKMAAEMAQNRANV